MTSSRDDDALGWAGDDDPTLVSSSATPPHRADAPDSSTPKPTTPDSTTPVSSTPKPTTPDRDDELAEGWTVTGEPGGYVDAPAGPAPMSSPALVGLGILGGVYLLYTVGWFVGISRIQFSGLDPLAGFMFALGTWLAVAAPAVWFGTSYWLTRGRPRLRWTWLILGALLLAPLPFIAGTGGL